MNLSSHRRATRALAFIAATATAASVGSGIAAISASAAVDTTPPVLTSLTTLPSSVDVSGGAGAIGVVLHVTDDLSGFATASASASCTTACGTVTTLSASTPTFTSGPTTDEQVDLAMTVPASVPDGSGWTVDSVTLNDDAGNSVTYAASPTGSQVAFPASAPTFTVTHAPDAVAPTVSSVQVLGVTPVDTVTADKTVGFRIHVNDAGSGVDESSLSLTLTPNNAVSVVQTIAGFSRVSGSIHSGDYETNQASDASFGVSDGGTWTISNIHVADLAAQSADLTSAAWPSIVVNGGDADTTGPQLSAGSPPSFPAGASPVGGDDVSLTSVITDDITGLQSATGTLSFLAGPTPGATAATTMPFSITTDDATTANTYVSTVHVPTNIAPGTYTLTDISLNDRAGNVTAFTAGDPGLPSLGLTVAAGAHDAGTPSVASLQTRPATVSLGTGLVATGGDRSAVAYVTVDDPAADSGFDHGAINVTSPTAGATPVAVPFDALNRVSGDAHAGVYRIFLSPQLIDSSADPADGSYTVNSVDVWSHADRDAAVASHTSGAAALDALPATTRRFAVAHAAGDIVPPAIQSIEVAPAHVNTSAADQALTVTVHATDTGINVSGIRSIQVNLASLISGATISGGTFGGLNGSFTGADSLQAGDDTDGTYVFTVQVPQWSTPGDWTLDSAAISDNEDNFWNYRRNVPVPTPANTDDISVVGGVSHGFTNDSASTDSVVPVVKAITVTNATPVSATDGAPYRVRGTIELTDAQAGVRDVEVDLNGPTGQVGLGDMHFTGAGPAADVILPWSALIPKNAATGDWAISVFAEDRAGNAGTVSGGFAAGIPTSVAVNGIVDTTAPSLADIAVPTSVDVTARPGDAVVTLHVTDDMSGMADFSTPDLISQTGTATVTYGRAGGTLGDQVVDAHVVGGSATDTILQADIPFAQFGQLGDWVVKSVNLADALTNASGAIDTSTNVITVVGAADTQAPTLTAVGLSADTLNLDASAAVVTVTAHLTDDVSGVASAVATLTGPAGQHASASLAADTPGVWTGVATVPQFSGAGHWTLTDLFAADVAGNSHDYLSNELAGIVTPAALIFTGTTDSAAPVLAGLDLTPTSVAIAGADQTVTATLHVIDDKSGLGFGMVTLTAPSGGQAFGWFDPTNRTDAGTGPDGTYATQLTIPATAEVGAWTVSDVYLEDQVGNSVDLLADTFPSGAVTTVHVTNTNPPVIDGVINGVVRTAAAAPVAGAPVTACPQSGGGCFTVKTGANGGYSITHLRDDVYQLYATAPQGSTLNTGAATLTSTLYSFPSHTASQNFTLTAPVAMPTGVSVNGQSSTAGAPVIPRVKFNAPINVTVDPGSCANGTGTITVTMADGTVLNETVDLTSGNLTESPAGSGHYTVSIPAASPNHGTATVSLALTCGGTARAPITFTLYIDPSGMVKDVNTGTGIAGANVTLMRSATVTGTYSPVANGSDVMSPSNRHNPDVTDGTGQYGWDVTAGFYKVRAQAAHCYAPNSYNSATNSVGPAVLSSARQIPPAVTSFNLFLDCTNIAPVAAFTQSPTAPRAHTPVSFNAGASKDANGSVASYSWNFGDGTTGTGPTPSHSYAAVGKFTPTLTVTDDQGMPSLVKTGSAITVGDVPSVIGGLTASSALHSVHLSWTAPAANNSAITGYTVDVTPGAKHLTSTATNLNVSGLTGNTLYTFTVKAVNGFGSGLPATTQAVAGAPNGPVVHITSKPKALTNATTGSVGFTRTVDPSVTLASVTCAVDGAAAAPCTSPFAVTGLAAGSHSVVITATDSDGNKGSASTQWVVDRVAPTVAMSAPASTTSLARTFVVRWSGGDANGVSSYDVRYVTAGWNSKLGAPRAWRSTTATTAKFTGALGAEYCFSARAHDAAGNVSGWSAAKCTAIPLDDRALKASAGWKKLTGKAFLNGTAMQAAAKGKTLTKKGAIAGRAVLYVDKGKGFGTITVLYNGKVVKKISLASTRAVTKFAVALPKITKKTTIVIKTTSAKKVRIDGLLLARV